MNGKICWSIVLAGVLLAGSADAARVKQVRVGDHAAFTRIVLELDGPAPYSWEKNQASGVAELVVDLDATTATRVITSRSRLVESVALRPGASGAIARVQLRNGDVQVKEMLLKSPHRIVLDISVVAPTVAASPPARAEAPKPRVVARAPAAPAPAPKADPRPALVPVPTPGPVANEPNAGSAGTDDATESPDPLESAMYAAAAASAESAADAGSDEVADPQHRPELTHPDRAAAASGELPASGTPEPETTAEPSPASGDSGLGLTWMLGGLAILLAALMLLRRRSARIAREAAAAPWPPPGAEERSEFATASGDEADSPHVAGAPETHVPLFAEGDREPTDTPAADDPALPAAAPPVAPPASALRAEPEVVAKEDAQVVEELERRIERLEARLSDSLDARERLERQLAAHTEELRVQRAAIARTQRAVRAAVRGPEGAAEPGVASPLPNPGTGESADH